MKITANNPYNEFENNFRRFFMGDCVIMRENNRNKMQDAIENY